MAIMVPGWVPELFRRVTALLFPRANEGGTNAAGGVTGLASGLITEKLVPTVEDANRVGGRQIRAAGDAAPGCGRMELAMCGAGRMSRRAGCHGA